MHKIFAACLTILSTFTLTHQTVYVIIHGTWARTSSWHQLGGAFFVALQKSSTPFHAHVVHIPWSGNADFPSRAQAGKDVARYLQRYDSLDHIYLIGHSHGANVGIVACQELERQQAPQKVEAFFALAVPVNCNHYMPPMNRINYFYNLFSCNDFVQPVMGIFGRVYPQHERIANIRLCLKNSEPDHTDMRDPLIAHWIPWLHAYAQTNNFDWAQDYYLTLTNSEPKIEIDRRRKDILQEDDRLIRHLAVVFTRKPQKP